MDDQTLSVRVVECLDTLDEIQHFRYWVRHPSEVVGELAKRAAETRHRELAKLPKRTRERELKLERKRERPKPEDENKAVEAQASSRLSGLYGLLHQQFVGLIDAAKQRKKDSAPLERVIEAVLSSEPKPNLPVDHGVSDELLHKARLTLEALSESPALPPSERQPVVQLCGIGQRPIVNGVPVEPLSDARYAVIEGLLASGRDGLNKLDLEKCNENALKYLRDMRKQPCWSDAILMPGKAWGRYAIRHA